MEDVVFKNIAKIIERDSKVNSYEFAHLHGVFATGMEQNGII